MVFTILLNKNNCTNIDSFKNNFEYKFVGSGLTLQSEKNNSIGLVSISMPFSIFNISGNFNNNSYSVSHNGSTFVNTIPNSFLDVSGLNKQLQSFLIANNLYLINDAAEYVYYIEFILNASLYTIQTKFYPVPSVLPVGWTNPGSMALTGLTMQLIISSTNYFYKLLGLKPATYPTSPSATQITQLSNTNIELSPINSINLSCNIVNNEVSVSPNVFYSFTVTNANFGEIVSIQPPEIVYVNCNSGSYQSIIVTYCDEYGRSLPFEDATSVIMLAFKSEDKPKK